MKQIKYLFYIVFIISLSSCESYIGSDTNANPNNVTDVPVSAILPSIQINLADVYGGEFSRINCMLVQQVEGVARGCFNNFNYVGLSPNRFNTVWTNVYEKILNEISVSNKIATENDINHYLGILNILEAYTLMIATDVWDDIPYSEALKGIEFLNPKYDKQEDIYTLIFQKLDDGIKHLNEEPRGLSIGTEDQYYQGDIQKWIKAAYAIKSRGLLHQAKYLEALNAANNSFDSSDDNMGFEYPDKNAASPWYRFNRDRTGDVEFSYSLRERMLTLSDTIRLDILNSIFTTTHPYLKANFFQELITYREIEFIKAECELKLNDMITQDGLDAYKNGIRASFERLGLTESEFQIYVSQNSILPAIQEISLNHIMLQKHIALFVDPESYSDYRRTGIPNLRPTNGTVIPVRWEYPQNEYSFNSSAPEVGSINIFTDKVGWNK